MAWTCYRDNPSLRLLKEQPDHGCDLCSRYRRRAVYQICSELGANVIAFGHTADDFCEALLRNGPMLGDVGTVLLGGPQTFFYSANSNDAETGRSTTFRP